MVVDRCDGVTFHVLEKRDFSWLHRYGRALSCIDETGSGCLCFVMGDSRRKVFCKVAGAGTIHADVSPQESVCTLVRAMRVYDDLRHPHLASVIEHYRHEDLYVAVYEWAKGECLWDHWNFERYSRNASLRSPSRRFLALPVERRLAAVEVLFSFLSHCARRGYVAVDFYDGSIIYDFDSDTTTICDVDLFRRGPVINTVGEEWPGTKRFKAPEEYARGSVIDERTIVFTLGAMISDFFGPASAADMESRYENNRFCAGPPAVWQLGDACRETVMKATDPRRETRFGTIDEFHHAWIRSVAAR
ncbi:MAG: hypothetical protein LKI77_06210 [Bifidobacterium sp.]|jgi:serine/threonine-protein kinase|nr:hypothetical protein [Bifidobacterium sp.]